MEVEPARAASGHDSRPDGRVQAGRATARRLASDERWPNTDGPREPRNGPLRNLALKPLLREGLGALGLAASEDALDCLVDYVGEIATWNRAYNLTAVRDAREMVIRHLLDSASVAPHVTGESVLDVGSGAGLPGIPLAVLQPERQFTLLDSNGKKARFLRHARRRLGLENVSVEEQRIEAFTRGSFDTLVSRAFAEPGTFLAAVAHVASAGCRVLAMQGRRAADPKVPEFRLEACVALHVPGLDARRHVLIFTRCPESSQ